MLLHKFRTPLIALLLMWLSGCATTPRVPQLVNEQLWKQQQQQLGQLTHWQLAGRISIQLEKEAWSASLYWTQEGDNYTLRIVAPLGRGTIEISGNKDSVKLHTADNRLLEDKDVDILMQQNLGWKIPVAALIYWIRGLPDPHMAISQIQLEQTGHLASINQSGWNVSYEQYTRVGTLELPSRMTIVREQLKLRLSINKWTMTDES